MDIFWATEWGKRRGDFLIDIRFLGRILTNRTEIIENIGSVEESI